MIASPGAVESASLPLAASRAILAGDVPTEIAGAPGVRCVAMRDSRRAIAPGASYAVDAVTALDTDLAGAAIFTFAGPPGSVLHLFDAGRESPAGPLVSAGFGRERSRRIHPFTVLLALQTVMQGEIYVSRPVSARLLHNLFPDPLADQGEISLLSDRELQVFQLLGSALRLKEIAAALKISAKTVETYRENIKNKLRLGDSEAVRKAAEAWVQTGKLPASGKK